MTNQQRIQKLMRNGSLEILLKLFTNLVGKESMDGKTGGYFTIQYLDIHNTVISKKLGDIPTDKKDKYCCLSKEKPSRLKRNLSLGHMTSYESRNPDAEISITTGIVEPWGHWGGAVLVSKYYIFSFSGFPELLDEAFVCFLGMRSGLMPRTQFVEVKKRRTDNPYLKLL